MRIKSTIQILAEKKIFILIIMPYPLRFNINYDYLCLNRDTTELIVNKNITHRINSA